MEKKTFEKLYQTYYMRVYSYVMTLSGKQHTAEEITQETFYRAFTAKNAFRGVQELFRTFEPNARHRN